MWNPFKKKTNTHVIPAGARQKQDWRNGMWVDTNDGVGVLFSLGLVESIIHLVDKDGITIAEKVILNRSLRRAKWLQIPEARRKVSKEQGFYLGYE